MPTNLHQIINTVRLRERSRRQRDLAIRCALLATAFTPPLVLAAWYPWWTPLLSLVPLGVVIGYLASAPHAAVTVSTDDASQLIDKALTTKERVRTFATLSQSAAAPDLVRSAFIGEQVLDHLPHHFDPASLVDLRLHTEQRRTLGAALSFLALSGTLFFARPISPLNAAANAITAVLTAHPELPEALSRLANDAVHDLSSSDLKAAQDSLQRANEELSLALKNLATPSSGERVVHGEDKGSSHEATKEKQPPPPSDSSPPQATPPPSSSKEEKEEQPREKQEEEQPKDSGESDSKESGSQSEEAQQRSKDGASSKDNNNGQPKGSAQEQDSHKGKSSGSGSAQKSEEGEGAGEGSGQGSGSQGSGSGSQGEEQKPSSQSQGASGEGKGGQGDGKGEGKEDGASQGSQNSGQSKGDPSATGDSKEGSSPGSSGLEELKNAVKKAQNALSQQQQHEASSNGEQGEGEKGAEGKGEKGAEEKGAEGKPPGRKGESPGEHGQGHNAPNSSAGEKKEGDSANAPGKAGSSQEQKGAKPPQEPNKDGKDSGGEDSGATEEKDTDSKPPSEPGSEGDGRGERSAQPDRNVSSTTEEPGPGGTGPTIPKPIKESQIGGGTEQFDSRFTGSDSNLEENKEAANVTTPLDDVLLAKPQGSLHKGHQPIPLEYRDILD